MRMSWMKGQGAFSMKRRSGKGARIGEVYTFFIMIETIFTNENDDKTTFLTNFRSTTSVRDCVDRHR